MSSEATSRPVDQQLLEIVEQSRHTACEELESLFEEKKGDITKQMIGHATLALCNSYKTLSGNHLDMLNILLRKKGDPNFRSKEGKTPLMVCAQKACVDLLDCLIKHEKIRIDQTDSYGRTALFYAIDSDNGENLNITSTLVHRGANINITDNKNKTPLMIAVERGHLETVRFLLDQGADFKGQTPEKEDLVTLAAKRNFTKIKELLEQKQSSVLKRNPSVTSLDTFSKKANYDGNSHSSNLGSIDVDARPNAAPVGPGGYLRSGNTGRPIVHPPVPKPSSKGGENNQTYTSIPPTANFGQPTHTMQDWKNRQGTNVVMDVLDAYDNSRPIDHKIELPINPAFMPPNPGQVPFPGTYMVPPQQYMKYPKGRGMHKDQMPDPMVMGMPGGMMGVPGGIVPHGAPPRLE